MSRSLSLLAAVAVVCSLSVAAFAQEVSTKRVTAPVKAVAKVQDAPVAVAPAQDPPAEEVGPALPNAQGFYQRADGVVTGQVTTIDQGSGNLLPMPFATVSFMQNRRFIAQGRTDKNGQFAVRGLTPWASYSVFVLSRSSIAMTGAIVRPEGGARAATDAAAPGVEKAANATGRNQIRLVATKTNVQAGGDALVIQGMPRDDFFTALQSGLFGDTGGPGAGPGGLPGGGLGGGGGGVGGGGGGSGGGGGGGGGGLGGLLAGAAGAIGFAASAAEGDDDASSPFGP